MPLTIAICTYRRFNLLKKCLESLKRQTVSQDELTIVVVDNSLSNDESISFRDALTGIKNLDYVITDASGVAYARNVAMERCHTDILAYIDDDAIAAPNWAEKILDAFSRYPAAGVIGGKVNPIWEKTPAEWIRKTHLLHALAVFDWGEEEIFVDNFHKWLVSANTAYRMAALRKCGGFNTSLGRKGDLLFAHEELATNIAIQTYGFDAMYIPGIAVDHLIQAERTEKSWFISHALWEGASRVVYENHCPELDAKTLSESLNRELMAFVESEGQHDSSTPFHKVVERYTQIGREVCRSCIGANRIPKKSDFYFVNIVSVIYLVTPCFNAVKTIDQAIQSIIGQAGSFSIRYHVQDGGSTDGTMEKLAEWKHRIEDGSFPIQCENVLFTFSSEPDRGMYDAVAKGFETMSIPPNAFMTWLNADDILMPGAFELIRYVTAVFPPEHVSWVSGKVSILKEDRHILQDPCNIPTDAVKSGLCDGTHWWYLQQEGTFFRGWLWQKVRAGNAIRNFSLAGDWNLWRLFAAHTDLATIEWPLAAFRMREGQLSQRRVDDYKEEIESVVCTTERDMALQNVVEKQTLTIRVLKCDFPTGELALVERPVTSLAREFYHKCFKRWPILPVDEVDGERIISSPVQDGLKTVTDPVSVVHSRRPGIRYDSRLPWELAQTFFVVTPSLNAAKTIAQTMASVIRQRGDFFIHYHVQDGGSVDGTVEQVKKMADAIEKGGAPVFCRGVSFSWSSLMDRGMYDAVTMGFDTMSAPPEAFMTWINADDVLLPGALAMLSEIGARFPRVQWVGGPQFVIETDKKILENLVPTATTIVRQGLCDGHHWPMLQQEGMFFKKRLWFRGRHALEGFTLAGDWNLWREFAHHADLIQCERALGAFRRRDGQLSITRFGAYKREMNNALPLKTREKRFVRLRQSRNLEQLKITIDETSGEHRMVTDRVSVNRELEKRCTQLEDR